MNPANDTSRKYHLPVWSRITISGLLLWYVIVHTDLPGAASRLAGTNAVWFVAMILTIAGSKVFTAYRWYVLVKCWEPDARFWPLVRITFTSNFFGMFLPGGATEVIRVAGLKQAGSSLPNSFSSVVFDRVVGLVSLVVMLLLGAVFFQGVSTRAVAIYASLALVCVVVFAVLALHSGMHGLLLRLTPEGSRLRKGASAMIDALVILRGRPMLILWSFVLAFGMQMFRVMWFYFGAFAVAVPLAISWLMILVPAHTFMVMLPVSLGGVGVGEAVLLEFFASLGFDSSIAIAFAVLLYVSNLIANLPGLWIGIQLLSGRKEMIRSARGQ